MLAVAAEERRIPVDNPVADIRAAGIQVEDSLDRSSALPMLAVARILVRRLMVSGLDRIPCSSALR